MCEGKWNTGLIPVISLLDTYFSVGFLQYSEKTILLIFWCGFVCLFVYLLVCVSVWFWDFCLVWFGFFI